MYCWNCGNRMEPEDNFCTKCGKKTIAPQDEANEAVVTDAQEQSKVENPDDQNNPTSFEEEDRAYVHEEETNENAHANPKSNQLLNFVAKNQHYYMNKWDLHGSTLPPTKFNFAAAFLNVLWMGYRKMYAYIFAIAGIFLLSDALMYLMMGTYYAPGMEMHPLDYVIGLVVFFVMGFWGNRLYYHKAEKETYKAQLKYQREEDQVRELSIKGGTSALGVFAAIGIMVGYSIISGLLFPYIVEPISYVQYSYFEGSDYTVQDEFSHYFDNPTWNFYREGSNDYVVFQGTDRLMEGQAEIVFWLGDDMWVVDDITFNGQQLTENEIDEYLYYILE